MLTTLLALVLVAAEPKIESVPAVAMVVKDGKIEARWKTADGSCAAEAAKVVIDGDKITLTGTAADPALMSISRFKGPQKMSGRQIEVSLSAGTIRIIDSGAGTIQR